MALIYADLVRESSTTTGTGALTLSAMTGYRRFADVMAVSDTCYYTIRAGSDWEVGLGTYSGTNTLTRTTVLASSNAGAALNLSAGSKDVLLTLPADKIIDLDKRRHNAPFTNSSGTTVTAAAHKLGASPNLTVSVYEDDGSTNTRVWVNTVVADNGDVTWSAAEAFSGFVLIQR